MVAVPIHCATRAAGRSFGDLEVHLWTFGPNGLAARLRHVVDARPFERPFEGPFERT